MAAVGVQMGRWYSSAAPGSGQETLRGHLDAGNDVVLSGFCYVKYKDAIQYEFKRAGYTVSIFTLMRPKNNLIDCYVCIIDSPHNIFVPWMFPQYPRKETGAIHSAVGHSVR